MSNLLLDDKPLIVLPQLAKKVGLNESIVLQQFHYWLKESKNFHDGHRWIYNTYEDWQKQFPFWSVRTLKRIITGLENDGYVITSNYNKLKIDRTKWYRINHQKLDSLVEHPKCQVVTMDGSSCHDGSAKLSPPLPEITTENTTESNKKKANPFAYYETHGFGLLNPTTGEYIGQWVDEFKEGEPIVIKAMEEAVRKNAVRWNYVHTILKDWHNRNLQTLHDVEIYLNDRNKPKQKKADNPLNDLKKKWGLADE